MGEPISESTIVSQIEKCGWLVTSMQEGSYLTHPQSMQVVFMSITPHWLCLSSHVKMQNPATLAKRVAYLQHLLQRNERMFMTKFSLDSDGTALLMIEIPLKVFSFPLINKALGSLARYTDMGDSEKQEPGIDIARINVQRINYELANPQEVDIEAGISKETFRRYMGSLGGGWGIRNELFTFPWHIGYKNILRIFEVYCTISRNWVSFQVPLLLDQVETVLDADLQAQAFFMEYLLRLSDTWFMAKTGINTNKQVLMLIEVPTEAFDFSLLQFITRTISTYIDRYIQEVQIMAALQQDTRLIELLHSSVY